MHTKQIEQHQNKTEKHEEKKTHKYWKMYTWSRKPISRSLDSNFGKIVTLMLFHGQYKKYAFETNQHEAVFLQRLFSFFCIRCSISTFNNDKNTNISRYFSHAFFFLCRRKSYFTCPLWMIFHQIDTIHGIPFSTKAVCALSEVYTNRFRISIFFFTFIQAFGPLRFCMGPIAIRKINNMKVFVDFMHQREFDNNKMDNTE